MMFDMAFSISSIGGRRYTTTRKRRRDVTTSFTEATKAAQEARKPSDSRPGTLESSEADERRATFHFARGDQRGGFPAVFNFAGRETIDSASSRECGSGASSSTVSPSVGVLARN